MKDNQKLHLEELQLFVQEMKNTSSLIAKKEIIKSYKGNDYIENALYYTYNPFLKYYVTSKSIEKNSHLSTDYPHDTIFNLLKHLDRRTFTGHEAIKMVNGFITNHMQFKNLILSIIDRNLEIRASESVINKVIPNLIPTFDVALATKYEPKFCDFENETWLASRKLDGVRCIIRKEEGSVIAYSRQGNEFTTLQKVLDDVAKWPGNFVLDGEICLMDKDGNEDHLVISSLKELEKLSKEWKKKLDDEKASVESIMREREDAKKLTKLTLPKLKKIKDGKKNN